MEFYVLWSEYFDYTGKVWISSFHSREVDKISSKLRQQKRHFFLSRTKVKCQFLSYVELYNVGLYFRPLETTFNILWHCVSACYTAGRANVCFQPRCDPKGAAAPPCFCDQIGQLCWLIWRFTYCWIQTPNFLFIDMPKNTLKTPKFLSTV